jgi:hypothetical protein|tara:strand:- start:324 stop:476 length:153 start_codon:yes stop_codon:yes gene_type:complete
MSDKNLKRFENAMTLITSILLIIALTIVFTSCGTSKRVGGCGGSPIHLGN